ncbi:MAG: heavy-metal-associated domain-containing protein [Oscillospiraceae bacterium]|nr:heavy-metal-associated domain-containing protein [Oscillospiraceae bacterium]
MTILLICGILCIIGAAVLAVMAFLPGGFSLPVLQRKTDAEPVVGGGGYYVLEVEGMDSTEQVAAVEAALAQFETMTSETDPGEGTVVIRYNGDPDLSVLAAIKKAVEETGCVVRSIE